MSDVPNKFGDIGFVTEYGQKETQVEGLESYGIQDIEIVGGEFEAGYDDDTLLPGNNVNVEEVKETGGDAFSDFVNNDLGVDRIDDRNTSTFDQIEGRGSAENYDQLDPEPNQAEIKPDFIDRYNQAKRAAGEVKRRGAEVVRNRAMDLEVRSRMIAEYGQQWVDENQDLINGTRQAYGYTKDGLIALGEIGLEGGKAAVKNIGERWERFRNRREIHYRQNVESNLTRQELAVNFGQPNERDERRLRAERMMMPMPAMMVPMGAEMYRPPAPESSQRLSQQELANFMTSEDINQVAFNVEQGIGELGYPEFFGNAISDKVEAIRDRHLIEQSKLWKPRFEKLFNQVLKWGGVSISTAVMLATIASGMPIAGLAIFGTSFAALNLKFNNVIREKNAILKEAGYDNKMKTAKELVSVIEDTRDYRYAEDARPKPKYNLYNLAPKFSAN